MARFGMWDPRKNDDYRYFDEMILEQFEAGGTGIYVHKYLGPKNTTDGSDPSQPNYDLQNGFTTEVNIQDLLFLENRDRNYDKDIYELYGVYNIQDTEFDLRQFGAWIQTDVIYLEFHLNDTIMRLGRKLMSGDVLEFPHLRDDALLNEDSPAVNKFYVVEDVTRAASGYSPTWFPHILRVKLKPMTGSQEFDDILQQPGKDWYGDDLPGGQTLEDIISDFNNQNGVSIAIEEAAAKEVDRRNFETRHFYVVPGDECSTQYPWIFAGDGHPPNGAVLTGSGNAFPEFPQESDWFLNTRYDPPVLFKFEGRTWRRKEVDNRRKWVAAHRILESFINNRNVTDNQGEIFPEKQSLNKAVKPRADF